MKPKSLILLTALFLTALLCAAPVAADAVSYNSKTYANYDQIYTSTTLSSSEKLSLVQEMAGWTPELEEYLAWKNTQQYYVSNESVDNTTTEDGGLLDGIGKAFENLLGGGGNKQPVVGEQEVVEEEPLYTEEEQAAFEEQYAAYQRNFAANYAATAAYTGSGSGTEADPYIITTPAELLAMVDDLDAYYKLGNDIDLSGFTSYNVAGKSTSAPFTGVVDGNGKILSNYVFPTYANTISYYSLFGYSNGATFKNIGMLDWKIQFSTSLNGVVRIGGLTSHPSTTPTKIDSCWFVTQYSITGRGVNGYPNDNDHGILVALFAYNVDEITNSYSIVPDVSVRNWYGIGVVDSVQNCYHIAEDVRTGFPINMLGLKSISNSFSSFNSQISPSYSDRGRIKSQHTHTNTGGTLNNNYASDTSPIYSGSASVTSYNGASVSESTYSTQAFWENTLGWDFDSVWYWDDEENLPKLQAFGVFNPTISAISATPATGGQETQYTLSVTAATEGVGGIAGYQWYSRVGTSGTWTAISGATGATATYTPGTSVTGDVYFKVVVTGADGGTVDSYTAGNTNMKITVVQKPQITAVSASPTEGPFTQTVTLSATVTSTVTTSYQWQELSGTTWNNINGATAATATVSIADSAATTHSYRLLATNVGGTTTSETVTYTSVAPPVISSVTANPTTGPLTQSVTLSASVSGATSYQWQEQSGSTWSNIAGATSATYTVSIADSTATTHNYRFLATNVGGTTTSETVTYTSVAPPTISSVTANPTTGPLTQSVTLSASVSGATSYQWQEQSGSTWSNIAGATSATYTVSIADSAATTHSYRLLATNVGGTTTSATVTYTSVAPPVISSVAANPTTGPLTQSVTLSATVSGATSYQWQEQSGSTWSNIAGATSVTYTVSIADTVATTHSYRLLATNVGGTTTSATVTYTSVVPPTINTVSATPASGPLSQTVTLTVSATGASQYQWQELTGTTWNNINGATASTHTVTISDNAPTLHSYRVIVTNVGGSITSDTVTYQSSQGPLITNAAANPTTGPLTQSVQLSATVTSDYAITYQWQEQIGGNWQNIQGATAATYTVSINDAAPTLHQYRLLATDIGGTTPSAVVTYQSVAPPVFESVSVTPEQGTYTSTVQLSATVSGADSLQWQEQIGGNWQNIQGATTAAYSLTLSDQAATQHSYRLQATNVGGTSTSNTVTYQSVAPPVFSSVSVTPTSGAMPLTISFSADASDTSGYRWEYSTGGSVWRQMASGASGSYTFTNEGTYSVRVVATGTGGQTISSVVSVSVVDYTPVFESVSVTPTAGVVPFSVTFTASATNSPDYVWEQRQGNSWVAVGFGSPFTLSIPYGTETGTLSFRAQASNDYGTAVSDVLTVSVGAPPRAEIIAPVDGATAAVNRAVSFSAYSAPGVAYSWDFGDGSSGSGSTVTHYYSEEGMYSVTLTATNQYGSSTDNLHIYVIVPTGEIFVTATDVSSSGVELTATVETTPVDAGTLVWFELESMSGTVVYKSPQLSYSGPVSYTASGLPLMAGETYRAVAYSNYYGYSIPVLVTLVDAVQPPYEQLGNAWNDGLNREPFNVSALVAAGVGVYGGALGGGAVGAAVAFGVIVMFVLVGLWLRQQDIVIPLTLTLIAGWFVIGNLPGDWQPIAYTLMVVCVVAIFFYLFRKRIE